jgi:hypothetical protein
MEQRYNQDPDALQRFGRHLGFETEVSSIAPRNAEALDTADRPLTMCEALAASSQALYDEIASDLTVLLPGVEITHELIDKIMMVDTLTPEASVHELYTAAQAHTKPELAEAVEQKQAREDEKVRQREAATAKARDEREARQQASLARTLRAMSQIERSPPPTVEELARTNRQTTQEWAQANPSQAEHMIGYGLMHYVHELPPWYR